MQGLNCSPCGSLVPTIEGQQAFVPDPLPNEIQLSTSLIALLATASHSVGTLVGIGETIPNPRLLISPLLRREAVLSSRIEGTVASLPDLFAYEAAPRSRLDQDIMEVMNYVTALEYGIEMIGTLPISFRLVNDIHEKLMYGVRGQDKRPGEFRSQQVWIGSPNSPIQEARFIPPPHRCLRDLFSDWETFINAPTKMPPLVQCALMHYQIEAIHPYSDGNGRIGRLLITLFLRASEVLPQPLLYLSAYFERDRQRYYDELLNVSVTGEWERWVEYFLTGILRESEDTIKRIRRLRNLQQELRDLLHSRNESANVLRLLEEMFVRPVTTVSMARQRLGISDPGTRRVLSRLADAGVVSIFENTWPKLYVAQRLLHEIDRPITPDD